MRSSSGLPSADCTSSRYWRVCAAVAWFSMPVLIPGRDHAADALAGGRKLLLAGNGGSAGDAQHLAGEFLARFNYDRAPIAAIVSVFRRSNVALLAASVQRLPRAVLMRLRLRV